MSTNSAEFFWKNGFSHAGRVLSREEAGEIRTLVERFEREHPEAVGKLDLKATLLFPDLDGLSAHPALMTQLTELMGPNIMVHSAAFRNKAPDGRTFVGWHQDTTYEQVSPPKIIGWLAVTDTTIENGCLRFIPGSHEWGQLRHEEAVNPDSMLSHGHYVAEPFDEDLAVDVELDAGEAVFFHHAIVHGSAPNRSDDRRMALFFDYVRPASVMRGERQSARLIHGVDDSGHYDHEPAPTTDYGPAEQATHRLGVEKLSVNFYAEWERDIEALSGNPRNRI